MPIKDFHCKYCEKIIDLLVKINHTEISCEDCGNEMEHIFTGQGPAFKGTEGFHDTRMSIPKEKDR